MKRNKEPLPFNWVQAKLCGIWLNCWFSGKTPEGKFLVTFNLNEGPERVVNEIRLLED